MNIEYIDLREDVLAYKFVDSIVYVNYQNKIYKVDFTNFEDGEMINSIPPIVEANKADGILSVVLRRPVDPQGVEIPQDDFPIDEYEEVQIEWKSQTDICDEELLESLMPTKEEIEMAELEISVINLLQDLEVI